MRSCLSPRARSSASTAAIPSPQEVRIQHYMAMYVLIELETECILNEPQLRQLSHIIPKPVTPFRRAQSVGATPGSRRTPTIQIRTPGTAARTPRGQSTRQVAARRVAPTTPHAIRALRERAHAARTPGRRRSGRIQRETPRDTLRALSRGTSGTLVACLRANKATYSSCARYEAK
jgi:hypothetical protein